MDRRKFLGYVGALTFAPALVGASQESSAFGLIVKLKAVPGRRDDLISILKESVSQMPGCVSYVLAKDSSDNDVVWITEVWESAASHEASLSLASAKNGMTQAKGMISDFSRIAVTSPVWEVGMPIKRPFI